MVLKIVIVLVIVIVIIVIVILAITTITVIVNGKHSSNREVRPCLHARRSCAEPAPPRAEPEHGHGRQTWLRGLGFRVWGLGFRV